MLRKIIGRPKSSNKKRKSQDLVLPKSLWGFYFKYAICGSRKVIAIWAFFYLVVAMDGVLFPNFQRWFIALFENPVPAGMTLMEHALPTITLIALLLLVIDGSALIRSTFAGLFFVE